MTDETRQAPAAGEWKPILVRGRFEDGTVQECLVSGHRNPGSCSVVVTVHGSQFQVEFCREYVDKAIANGTAVRL